MNEKGFQMIDITLALVIMLLGCVSAFSMVLGAQRGIQARESHRGGWRIIASAYLLPERVWEGERHYNRHGQLVQAEGFYRLVLSRSERVGERLYTAEVSWLDEALGKQVITYTRKELADASL